MIAYLEKYDTTVDLPDNVGEKDIHDINNNFHSYLAPKEEPQTGQPAQPGQQPAAPAPKGQPNFFEGFLKHNMESVIPGLALSGLPVVSPQEMVSPQTEAFTGKFLQEASFGVTKPWTDKFLGETYNEHPGFALAGQFAGGIGSLMETGVALKAIGLGAKAAEAGKMAVEAGLASGSRFIPKKAIMTGATFGTRAFIAQTVKAFQDGKVDLVKFGEDVIKDTAFGATFGAIGGIQGAPTAVALAAALGFISKKMEGGDLKESILNSAIWATFEAIGSFGRDAKLITEALDNLGESVGEYVEARNPGQFGEEGAKVVGKAFVENEVKKAGFESTEEMAKNGPENALKVIENINQVVRKSIVPAPEAPPEAPKPLELEATKEGEPKWTTQPEPKPNEPSFVLDNGKGAITTSTDEEGNLFYVGHGPNNEEFGIWKTPDEAKKGVEEGLKQKELEGQTHENIKNASLDKEGVPVLKDSDVVSNVKAPDGSEITHGMVKGEAEDLRLAEREQFESDKELKLINNIGKIRWTKDEEKNGGWQDQPWMLRKIVFTKDQKAEGIDEKAEAMGITSDELRHKIFDEWNASKKAPPKDLGPYYKQALNDLEGIFSGGPAQREGVSIQPGQGQEPTGQNLPFRVRTGPAREEFLRTVFPQTEISSTESIAKHPDFVKLTEDAAAVVDKYARAEEIKPTPEYAENLWRKMHNALNEIMKAKPEERDVVRDSILERFPDIEREFATLRDKLWTDQWPKWFDKNVKDQYGAMRPKVSVEETPETAEDYFIRMGEQEGYAEKELPLNAKVENVMERYERLKRQAVENGMTPGQALKWARSQLSKPAEGTNEPKSQQTEFSVPGGVQGFGKGREGEGELFAENFPSSKAGVRQQPQPGEETASLKNKLGGLEYVQQIQGPEMVKLAKQLSGNVPIIKKLMQSLGYFKTGIKNIAIRSDQFSDKDWTSILAHEIGHLIDYLPEETMARGNLLGRIGSFKKYMKSLLPESPESTEEILTPKDRQRFRSEAERIAKGKAEEGPDKEFNPQAILDVWNSVTSATVDPELLEYVKGLDVDAKKSLIKGAMMALKNGENITVHDINKFNKEAGKDYKRVADIYRDLIKKEIKKRKLWENEVIKEEFRNLSTYWKPFNPNADARYTAYRFSSPELYADFISVLLNAPARAKMMAPNGYQAFFNYLENKPEVMANLLEIQALVQSDDMDLQKVRGEDILKMFEKGEQAFRARQQDIQDSKKSTWDKLKVLFWDKNKILLDMRDKLNKQEKLKPDEDPKYAIEKYSMMASFLKSYLDNLDRLVIKPVKAENLLNELKTVLFLDRIEGGDRSEMANPLGHTPETAKAFLDNMKKINPAKFERVNQLADQARKWFKEASSIKGVELFFTPEQIFTHNENEKYAPNRVIDHMKDYMASGDAPQIGSFKDIGDPLTALTMKGVAVLQGIERNRLKYIIGHALIKLGAIIRRANITNYPGVFKIEEPQENYLGTMAWKEGGQWVAYHVDKYIADLFKATPTNEIGKVASSLNFLLGNRFFRPLYTIFNLNFTTALVSRDFIRSWRLNPQMSLGTLIKNYISSVPASIRRVKGTYDPLIQEMERAGALQHLKYNDLFGNPDAEEEELEHLLDKYIRREDENAKFSGIPIVRQVQQIKDFIHFTTDTLLTIPKVAGWKALEDMPEEQRSYVVRNMLGHPNFKRTGTAAPVTNALFLFSNMFKEGLRDSWDAATDESTRKTYWTRTAVGSILPKILMAMCAVGVFGDKIKNIMNKMSHYIKANYMVIPLGVDSLGNGIALTIPQDEDGRIWGALMWAMLSRGNIMNNLSEVLAFGEGLMPSFSPAFSLGKAWSNYLSGGKPRDTFKGQDILTDQERAAGGMYSFEPMARWTLNQSGLVRMDIRDRLKDEPVYKTVLGFTPILQRLIRVEKTGQYEQAKLATQPVIQEEARKSLDLKREATEAIRARTSEEDFVDRADTPEDRKKFQNAFRSVSKNFNDDPIVSAVGRATSTDAKVAILEDAKRNYANLNEYNDFIDMLDENKIISDKVAIRARE